MKNILNFTIHKKYSPGILLLHIALFYTKRNQFYHSSMQDQTEYKLTIKVCCGKIDPISIWEIMKYEVFVEYVEQP